MNTSGINEQLEWIRNQLLQNTQKLQDNLKEQLIKDKEADNLNITNESRDTAAKLLEAIANRDKQELVNVITAKLGSDFLMTYEQLTEKLFHVDQTKQNKQSANKSAKKEEQEVPKKVQQPSQPAKNEDKPKGGLIKGVFGIFSSKKEQKNVPTQIILNENEQKSYYCQKRKRYVFQGEEEEEDKPTPPPPKKSELQKPQQAKDTDQKKTEIDSMTAPPSYSRAKRKGTKQEKIIQNIIPILSQLPKQMDFDEFRTQLNSLIDSAKQASVSLPQQAQSNINLNKLYAQLELEQQLASSILDLTRDAYDLLLSNSSMMPPHQIHIINQSHGALATIVNTSNSRLKDTAMEAQLEKLQHIAHEYRQKQSDYEAQISRSQQQIAQLQTTLQEEHEKMELRVTEKEDIIRRVNSEASQAHKLKEKIYLLEDQLKHLKYVDQHRRQLESRLRFVESQLAKKQQSLETLQHQCQANQKLIQMQRQNEDCIRKYYNTVLKNKNNLSQLTQCLTNENVLLEKVKKKRTNLSELLNSALESKIQGQIALLQSQAEQTPSKFLEVASVVNDIINKSVSSIKEHQSKLKEMAVELQNSNQRANAYKETAEAKIQSLNTQLIKIKSSLDNYKSQADQSFIKVEGAKKQKSKLQRQLEKTKHDNNYTKSLIEQATKNQAMQTKKISELQEMINLMQSQQVRNREQLSTLQQERKELQELIETVSTEKDKAEETAKKLKSENELMKDEIEAIKSDLAQKSSRLEELEPKYDANVQNYELLYEMFNTQTAELKAKITQISTKESELRQLLEHLQSKQAEMLSKEAAIVQHQQTIQSNIAEIALKDEKVQKQQNRIQELESIMGRSSQQNSNKQQELQVQITKMQSDIEQSLKLLSDREDQLEISKNKQQQLSSKITKLQCTIDEMGREHEVTLNNAIREATIKANQQLNAAQMIKHQQLEQQYTTSLNEIKAAKNAEIQEIQTKLNESETVLIEMDAQLEALNQQKSQLYSTVQQLKLKLHEAQHNIDGLAEDLQMSKAKTQQESKKVNEYLEVVKHLQDVSSQKGHLMSTLEHQLQKRIRQNRQLGEIISTLNNQKQQLKLQVQAHQEMNKAEHQSVVQELRNKLQSSEQQLSDRQAIIQAMNQDLQQKQHDRVKLSQTVHELQQKLEQQQASEPLKKKLAEDEILVAQLKEQIAQIQFDSDETKAFYERKLQECQSRLGQMSQAKIKDMMQIEQITVSLNNKLNNLNEEYIRQVQINKQLMFDLKEAKNSIDKLEKSQADTEKIQEMEQVIEEQEAEINRLENKIASLTKPDSDLNELIQAMEDELNQNKSKITQLEENRKRLESTINSHENTIQKLKTFIEQNKQRQSILEEKITKMEVEASAPKAAEVKKMQDRLKELQTENEQLVKQKVCLINSNEQLLAKLSNKEKEEKSHKLDKPTTQPKQLPKDPKQLPKDMRQPTKETVMQPTRQPTKKPSGKPQPKKQPESSQGFFTSFLSKLVLTDKQQQQLQK